MQRLALIALASISCLMSQADASPLQDTIATDLSFIEQQVSKTLDSLGSVPAANPLYPVRGRRQRNVEDDESFGRSRRMDNRVFPGPALAPVSGDRVDEVARCGAGVDRPAGHAGLVGPSERPHGHRLHHRDEFRQRVPADGKPRLQKRAYHHRQLIVVALQFKGRRGSILDFPSISFSRDHRQHDDAWAVAVGRQQWRHFRLGRNGEYARPDGDHESRALGRQHVSALRFQPGDRSAGVPPILSDGGLSATSVWARGQAWALYGFVQAYQTSDNPTFLTTAEDVANYFVGQLVADHTGSLPGISTRRRARLCGHLGGGDRGGWARHAEYGGGNDRASDAISDGCQEHTRVAQHQLP